MDAFLGLRAAEVRDAALTGSSACEGLCLFKEIGVAEDSRALQNYVQLPPIKRRSNTPFFVFACQISVSIRVAARLKLTYFNHVFLLHALTMPLDKRRIRSVTTGGFV